MELKKTFQVRGYEVTSEITQDRVLDELVEGKKWRSIFIKTSCSSQRWGTRTLEHSYNCFADSFVPDQLERARKEQAEVLVRQELEEIPDGPTVSGAGIRVSIPGQSPANTTLLSQINLSDRTRIQQDFAELIKLPLVSGVAEPLYAANIHFGEIAVQLIVGNTKQDRNGFTPAAVLGGDFFQAYLQSKSHLISELLDSEPSRTLRNISRCKKKTVLIIGHYGDDKPRLERIRGVLKRLGYMGILAEDFDDIEEQDLPEKVITLMSMARFVICDDVVTSGHNSELEMTKWMNPIVAVLRQEGKPSTMMQATLTSGVEYRKAFEYRGEELEPSVETAVTWAEEIMNHGLRNGIEPFHGERVKK